MQPTGGGPITHHAAASSKLGMLAAATSSLGATLIMCDSNNVAIQERP
jgi:hypothetical protein